MDDAWKDAPIVTFSRDGQEITLGRDPEEPVLHLYGSTGLGLPPASVASSDRLAGDGSIIRGVRYDQREVFIPLLHEADTVAELTERRRMLYRLLAPHLGPVDVRIQDPATGTDRTISGYLIDGLTGNFGESYYGTWQTLGLKFQCPDPWWMGAERTQSFSVNPGSKPFISDTVPFFPIILAESAVVGKFSITVYGDGPVFPVWEVLGPGADLVISNGTDRIEINGSFAAGEVVRIDTRAGRIVPDRWADVPTDTRLFSLAPGPHTLTVTMAGATTATLVRLTYRERFLEAL